MLKRKQRVRVERGRGRAEAVGERVERKRGLGRRGEGRNVSFFGGEFSPYACCWVFLFGRGWGGGMGKESMVREGEGKVLWVESGWLIVTCAYRLIGTS